MKTKTIVDRFNKLLPESLPYFETALSIMNYVKDNPIMCEELFGDNYWKFAFYRAHSEKKVQYAEVIKAFREEYPYILSTMSNAYITDKIQAFCNRGKIDSLEDLYKYSSKIFDIKIDVTTTKGSDLIDGVNVLCAHVDTKAEYTRILEEAFCIRKAKIKEDYTTGLKMTSGDTVHYRPTINIVNVIINNIKGMGNVNVLYDKYFKK